jgi:hypothetical protein
LSHVPALYPADQGLLYHWCKYVKKSVSILFRDRIENYGSLSNGTVFHESTTRHLFLNSSVVGGGINNSDYPRIRCLLDSNPESCIGRAPASNYVHFTGNAKPWFHGPPQDLSPATELNSGKHLWYTTLSRLNDRLQMGLHFASWETGRNRRPLLGMYPKYGEILTMNTSILSR